MTGGRYSDEDRAAVRQRVPIEQEAPKYVARWRKRGSEYLGLCPFHKERTPSFTVVPAKRFFHCFGCGAHGDIIKFYMDVEGVSYPEAMARLLEKGGLTSEAALARAREHAKRAEEQAGRADERDRRLRQGEAERLWAQTKDGRGTLVERYLAARGLDLALLGGLPADLRFLPAHDHWDDDGVVTEAVPCMAAALRDMRGALLAVHLTFLKADGSGKAPLSPAKKIKGPGWGGHIDVGPAGDRSASGGRLAAGEGIETCLSWRQLRLEAGRDDMPVWAAGTLGNLCGAGAGRGVRRAADDPRRDPERRATWRLPSALPDPERPGLNLPIGIQDLHLLRERDGNDPAAYEQLFERARARFSGTARVWVEDPGAGDHNDLLRAGLNSGGGDA